MSQMPIIGFVQMVPNVGDFNVEVRKEGLVVSQQIADMLAKMEIQNAEEFVSMVHGFPISIAVGLGWKLSDVFRARELLIKELTGHISGSFLDPRNDSRPYFGARPPSHRT